MISLTSTGGGSYERAAHLDTAADRLLPILYGSHAPRMQGRFRPPGGRQGSPAAAHLHADPL